MPQRRLLTSAAIFAMCALGAAAQAGEATLTIKDFVGRITIETDGNQAIKVTNKTRAGDVDFDQDRESLVIDGGISNPDGDDCKGYYGNVSWSLFGKKEKKSEIGGYSDLDNYPDLTISGPEDMTLVIENSIPFGRAGNIGAADIEMQYCGRFFLGDINGPARFTVNGSGDIEAGNIETLQAKINGSGDLELRDVGDSDITIRGSGDVEFKDAENMNLSISGSGDAEGERISGAIYIKSSGSGDVDLESVDGELTYDSRGSGDLSINEVNGTAMLQVRGSGTADIDEGSLTELIVIATGSSDVHFGGRVQDADLTARGSSDVYVDTITGTRKTRTTGSGDIHIDN